MTLSGLVRAVIASFNTLVRYFCNNYDNRCANMRSSWPVSSESAAYHTQNHASPLHCMFDKPCFVYDLLFYCVSPKIITLKLCAFQTIPWCQLDNRFPRSCEFPRCRTVLLRRAVSGYANKSSSVTDHHAELHDATVLHDRHKKIVRGH